MGRCGRVGAVARKSTVLYVYDSVLFPALLLEGREVTY